MAGDARPIGAEPSPGRGRGAGVPPAAPVTLPDMSVASLGPFFALTFGLGWGTILLIGLFTDQVEAVFGPLGYTNPLFVLAVYSPALAGLILVWRHDGARGIGRLLRRLTLWRMPFVWWAFLAAVPVVFYLGAAIKGTIADPFPFVPWYGVVPALATTLVIGPIEELGWRGVALPLLQRRFAPLWAGLILGLIWALWHAPAFLLSGTKQSAWAFGPFFIGVVALAVILTPMFNAARGSLLIPALFHFQMNADAWPDAQPWDMYLFVLLAVVVVFLNRRTMLGNGTPATQVLMPPGRSERPVATADAPI
jgi:uncharacterized protein